MNARHHLAAALLACLPLVACSNSNPPPSTSTDASRPTSSLGKLVEKEINEAREKLATENISINGGIHVTPGHKGGISIESHDGDDSRPKAEITPQGDLLIDGKPVEIDAKQRAQLLEYRGQIIQVAEAGMDLGIQGADLAAKAMGEAFKGLFSGKSEDEIEKSVEAEASGIKQAAKKLCGNLPAMMASQQKLAASLPEFKPYATMTQEDIDDCMKEGRDGDFASNEKASQIREQVRQEIHDSIRESVREAARDSDADSDKDSATKQ